MADVGIYPVRVLGTGAVCGTIGSVWGSASDAVVYSRAADGSVIGAVRRTEGGESPPEVDLTVTASDHLAGEGDRSAYRGMFGNRTEQRSEAERTWFCQRRPCWRQPGKLGGSW